MPTCAICRRKFESENPALLTVSRFGAARVLCPECESLLDRATGDVPEEAEDARRTLAAVSRGMRDAEAMRALREVLDGSAAACDEAIEEEYEALKETDEERAAEEKEQQEEEEAAKKQNPFLAWLPLILVFLLVAGLSVYFIFFRG